MNALAVDWKEVDRNLRSVAVRRAALDANEARWLREAERLRVWRELGMASALDYLERVLGYGPHAGSERLRVARALGALPVLEAALERGELNFSALRELTRVATPETEAAWCERAAGKNVRQIEELVAGHAQGDHPDDPADPDLRTHTVRFALSPEVFARLRQVQAALADEHGGRLDDDALVTALCEAVFDRGGGEPTGRAKAQILMTICKRCDQGWQEGAGVQVAVDPAAVERARCDAQYIGSTDDPEPARAEQDIPPRVARFVWRRDGGRCQTPGCRSARGLEIHHIVHRADGGGHDPDNLRLMCSACHMALHRGALELVGGDVRRPNAPIESDVNRTPATSTESHVEPTPAPSTESHVGPTSAPSTASPVGPTRATSSESPVGPTSATSSESPVGPTSATSTASPVGPTSATSTASPVGPTSATSTASPVGPTSATSTESPVGPTPAPSTESAVKPSLPSSFELAAIRVQARDALVGLGWKPSIARAAVEEAASHAPRGITLEVLIREALRRCPRPGR